MQKYLGCVRNGRILQRQVSGFAGDTVRYKMPGQTAAKSAITSDMEKTDCILVVDDDRDIRELLGNYLNKNGFKVIAAADGRQMRAALAARPVDLIVLDLMLPGEDGLVLCRDLRAKQSSPTPILVLTARDEETDRIVGLELGASDYVVKPFFVRELIVRIKLQFRTAPEPSRVVKIGPIELDRGSCRAKLDGRLLGLTATEFRLLEFMMSRQGVVFSRDQLLDAVWGQDRAITDRAVDVYVLRLRQKVEEDPANPRMIHSVRGFGYTFELRERTVAA